MKFERKISCTFKLFKYLSWGRGEESPSLKTCTSVFSAASYSRPGDLQNVLVLGSYSKARLCLLSFLLVGEIGLKARACSFQNLCPYSHYTTSLLLLQNSLLFPWSFQTPLNTLHLPSALEHERNQFCTSLCCSIVFP